MANTTAATALEMEADALSGLTDVDLANMGCMTIDEATRIRADDDQARAGGQPLIAEETITREGRRWHFYSIKSLLMAPPAGQVLGISIDVTADRAAMEMPGHGKLCQAFFDASDDTFLIEDTEGRIIDCNLAACAMYGYDRAALVDMRALDLVPPSERGRLEGLDRLQQRTGSVFVQSQGLAKDGSIFPTEVTRRLVELEGTTLNLVQIRDISDRRRLEGQMRLATKMEAIGRLAGGIAHEFNNLLTVINGYSEFLINTMEPADGIYDDLVQINQAGLRAAELTRQLLAFSRRQTLPRALVDLNLLIEELDPLLRSTASETVRVLARLAPDLGGVQTSRSQIEQIIVHLAMNACDAMPDGGTLTLSTANVTLSPQDHVSHLNPPPGDYVCLAVSDTGQGMSPEVCEHLFEPFFTTKEVGQGTGLGLAMIYGTIQDLGGAIDVSSRVGEGSVFRVYLPRAAAGEAEAAPEHDGLPHGRETLLLVENAGSRRSRLARMLTRLGYAVIEADGAAEALRVVTQRGAPPDLVIVEEVVSDRAPAGGNGADHAGDDGAAAGLPAAELVAQIHTLYAQMPALVIRQAEEKGDGNGTLPSLVAPLTVEQVARGVYQVLHQSSASPARRFFGHNWMDPLPNMS